MGEIMFELSESKTRKKFKRKERLIGISYKLGVFVLLGYVFVEEYILFTNSDDFVIFRVADGVKYGFLIALLTLLGVILLFLLKYKYNYVYV